jgi:4-hydroxythreonine-4-phosphate dehydrogenase
MEKTTVGITMGDPAGIGPEIVIKALSNREIYTFCKPVVIGDSRLLRRKIRDLKGDVTLRALDNPRAVAGDSSVIEVIDLHNVDLDQLRIGRASREAGKASLEYIKVAVHHALNGNLDAITTAPINKEAIHLAGSTHIGHTELIGALTNSVDPITVFWCRGVFIFFLTRHLSLKKAIEAVKKDEVVRQIVQVNRILSNTGSQPRIAIAALNPHASDGGLVGDEEEREIVPAVKALREMGINASGPIPADAVFHQAFSGSYDAVLSLYHDQGHIAAKTADFFGTVSVTLNLPFIRTSVDHGTGYEIARENAANPASLEKAIRVAVDMERRFGEGGMTDVNSKRLTSFPKPSVKISKRSSVRHDFN